jgi:hypothetical protein
MNEPTDLKSRLERLADVPAPPQRADLTAARARGDRVILTRRLLLAAGSGTAAGALLFGAAMALPGSTQVPVRPAAVPVAPPSTDPDLLIRRASFGWLPAGFHVLGTESSKSSSSVTAELAGTAKGLPSITLDVYPSRSEPPEVYYTAVHKRETAAPVNGRPAYWMAAPHGSSRDQSTDLRWAYGPHSSAMLSTHGNLGGDLTQTVHRIAEAVTFSSRRAAFPIRIAGLPSALHLTDTGYGGTGANAGALFRFVVGDGRKKSIHALAAGDLEIFSDPESTVLGKRNTTIGGHPAHDSRVDKPGGSGDVSLWISGYQGTAISIIADSDAVQALRASGGIDGLIQRITVLGPDPAHWTTSPLG